MSIKRLACMIMGIVLILSLSACGKTYNTDNRNETDNNASNFVNGLEKANELMDEVMEPEPNDVNSYLNKLLKDNSFDDSITYDQLARTSDDYEKTPIYLTGKIVQITDGDDFKQYRLAMDEDYDQMVFVESYSGYPIDTVIEDDYVAIYGAAWGKYTYTAVFGNEITIPLVLAAKIELAEKPTPTLPNYPAGPLTLEKHYSSGKIWSTTYIESFEITNAEFSYSGDLDIDCQVIGTVKGSDTLSINLDCYDEDGFIIKSTGVYASVKFH